jgi:hypothetical protein
MVIYLLSGEFAFDLRDLGLIVKFLSILIKLTTIIFGRFTAILTSIGVVLVA